ncbi:MAG: hypothetical protein Q8L10_05475 [Candidatus Moranbacteria bacterium]|nr:hypothetical protein [Candidatus Moranbacteria bacterium]
MKNEWDLFMKEADNQAGILMTSEDRKKRNEASDSNLAKIIEKYDAYFCHGFSPGFIPGTNSLLKPGTSWQMKLKILLALYPTLSAFSIKAGDSSRKAYAATGVILNQGQIEKASTKDVATIAHSINHRSNPWQATQPNNMADDIQSSIHNSSMLYNELVISTPNIAGLYVWPERRSEDILALGTDPIQDIETHQLSQELNVPVFIFQQGTLFEANYNPESRTFENTGKIITPKDILNFTPEISTSQKERLLTEVLDAAPFNVRPYEVKCFENHNFGAIQYAKLNFKNFPKHPSDHKINYHDQPAELIGHYYNHKGMIQLMKTGDKLVAILNKEGVKRNNKTESVDIDFLDITTLESGMYISNKNIRDNKSYITRIESEIRKNLEWIKKSKNERVKMQWAMDNDYLACALYGFGIEAGKIGDLETQNSSFAIAKQYFLPEKYSAIMQKRGTSNGHLRHYLEDIA